MDYRLLTHSKEFTDCIALQKEIWGLEDDGVTSPITLKALSLGAPPVGLLTGAYDGDTMVGFSISMGAMAPGVVYGHMFGVLEEYRDQNVGAGLFAFSKSKLLELGIREMVFTYEPLESRNAYFYLNKEQGHCFRYEQECFQVHSEMNDGLPLDRMVARFPLDAPRKPSLIETLDCSALPEATPVHMPDEDAVLVRIPGDLAKLKAEDMDRAMRYRMETRVILTEYLNNRHYRAVGLHIELTEGDRVSRYVLTRKG